MVLFKSGIIYHTTGMVKKTHPKCGVCRQSCYSSEIICLLGKMNIKVKQAVSWIAIKDLQALLWVYKCPFLYK